MVERPWDEKGDEVLAERVVRYREQDAIRAALRALGGPEPSLRGRGVDFKRSEFAAWIAALVPQRAPLPGPPDPPDTGERMVG